jgi:hypothetical protein
MGAGVTAEQRQRMIAEAAYFRAQRRGFQGGNPLEDWLAAEAEIDCLLRGSDGNRLSITQQELDELMARADQAQLELLAESLRIRLAERKEAGGELPRMNGADALAWEALSAALASIGSGRK